MKVKNILLPLVLAFWTSWGCQAQSGYEINGTLTGSKAEHVYLTTYFEERIDTLGISAVTEGKFQFSGNIEEVTVAYISAEGMRGMVIVFLEDNTSFEVTMNAKNVDDSQVKGGGDVQRIFNEYQDFRVKTLRQQQDANQKMSAAMAAKDSVAFAKWQQESGDAYRSFKTQSEEFTRKYKDTYVGTYQFLTMMRGMDIEKVKEEYALLSEPMRKSNVGREIARYISRVEQINVGQIAPDFTLPTPDGKSITLHAVKGKVKLLDFWASWCQPCRKENPNLLAIYDEFRDKGLEIIGVSLDSRKEDWIKAIQEDQLTWLHALVVKGNSTTVQTLYNVQQIPQTFLLDEANRIVAIGLRGDELKAMIAELLK